MRSGQADDLGTGGLPHDVHFFRALTWTCSVITLYINDGEMLLINTNATNYARLIHS